MKKTPSLFRALAFTSAAALAILAYFYLLRPQTPAMPLIVAEGALLGLLALLSVGAVLFILVSLAALLFARESAPWKNRLRGQMIFLLSALLILTTLVGVSQLRAHTPAITDPEGAPLPNSIASLERVRLGGVDQWLIIRGEDVNKPVLLFLSGGPGASEAGRVLRFNQELEKHFVVVIWEQRGCGKSYPSLNPREDLTVEQYAKDIVELSELLRARFDEDKIYLVGHSWGTIPSVRAVQARPDLFHAYVGSAQMVDVLETDHLIYDMVMERSRQSGDSQFVQTLEKQGRPPYTGKNPIVSYATLFGREYQLFEVPNIKNRDYLQNGDVLFMMLKQPEYGWLDRIYFLLGMLNTFNVVYPQLQDMDYRLDATHFEVPVYLMLGRHDMNNPPVIPQEYFDLLEAPRKELIYFEESGHGMIWEEADLFHKIMAETILPETYQ